MKNILITSVDNWDESTSKPVLPFAPQAQGTGKTFLGANLPHFLNKTGADSDFPFAPIVSNRMQTYASELFNPDVIISRPNKSILEDLGRNTKSVQDTLEKLRSTRPIIIKTNSLLDSASSLDRAMMISALSYIRNVPPEPSFIDELLSEGMSTFATLCKIILKANGGAAVIILDDLIDLVGNPHATFLRSGNNETAVITAIKKIVAPILPMPGMVLYMTGRAPQAVYRKFETLGASPLCVYPIMLDALSIKDIIDILYRSRHVRGSYSELLGLRNNLDIQDLACILYWYTGGLGRVVSDTLDVLQAELDVKVRMQNRPEGAGVDTVLTYEVMTEVFTSYIEPNHSILPRWSRMLSTWDRETSMRAALKLLRGGLNDELVNIDTEVHVGTPNGYVRVDDFLSIMGVPFVLVDDSHLRIFVSPWMVAALSADVPFVSQTFQKNLDDAVEELRKASLESLFARLKLLLSP